MSSPFNVARNPHQRLEGIIDAGQFTRPIVLDSSTKIEWAHKDCVDSEDRRIPVCKHWKSKGMCMFKDKCQFRHPKDAINSESRQRRRHGTWGRKRVYNEGRVSAVRRWLLNVFGREFLLSGSGLIDVAGGKGEFSFEACNLNDIPSTVFDPRPLDLYRYKRKLQFGFYHRNEVLGDYNHMPQPADGIEAILPTHIRGFFEMFDSKLSGSDFLGASDINDMKKITCEGGLSENDSCLPIVLRTEVAFAEGLSQARSTNWTTKGLTHEDEQLKDDGDDAVRDADDANSACGCMGSCESCDYYVPTCTDHISDRVSEVSSAADSMCTVSTYNSSAKRNFEPGREVTSLDEAKCMVRDCSMVVGMHPDQAAEHLIDFALRNHKPFAVVPCCVYHRQFPHRLLAGGSGGYVKSYGEFIEYLMRKSPQIHALQMDFEGKNILLYYMADREPLAEPSRSLPHICRGAAVPEMWWALSSNQKVDGKTTNSISRSEEEDGVDISAERLMVTGDTKEEKGGSKRL